MDDNFNNWLGISGETQICILARFTDSSMAEAAMEAILTMLSSAEREVEDLFKLGEGLAESSDVARIYERYGFYNDTGWKQKRPLRVENDELIWEIPQGLLLDDAHVVLVAFGASEIAVVPVDSEPWREAPHPMIMTFFDEERDLLDREEDEFLSPHAAEKKTLH